MLEPIKTEKIYNIIMRQITALINEQGLEPGDKLPSERELAAALSVSRSSVRQAIAALSAKGVVAMRHGDGTYVSSPEEEEKTVELFGRYLAGAQIDPNEILEVRLMVECESARLCAIRASADQLSALQALLERTRYAEGRSADLETMNRDLHSAIAEGARNKALNRIMDVVWEIMGSNMWPLLKSQSNNREQQIELHLDQHEEIVAAICARDQAAASTAMRRHLTSIEQEMYTLIAGA
jgi:GntR family transcriptional repressor for pyruvate dehydrogenase complex